MKRFASTVRTASCRMSCLSLILMAWGTSVQAAEPIPIPVPPPEAPTLTAQPVAPKPIPIPVPPPEVPTLAPLPQPTAGDNTHERLAVPSTPIPMGDVGSDVAMNQLPPPPNASGIDAATSGRTFTTGGRFRVIVFDLREEDIANQERLRSLVPEVLPVKMGQQRALQVGSFQDEIKAKELRAYMEVNGFRAEIQRLP